MFRNMHPQVQPHILEYSNIRMHGHLSSVPSRTVSGDKVLSQVDAEQPLHMPNPSLAQPPKSFGSRIQGQPEKNRLSNIPM